MSNKVDVNLRPAFEQKFNNKRKLEDSSTQTYPYCFYWEGCEPIGSGSFSRVYKFSCPKMSKMPCSKKYRIKLESSEDDEPPIHEIAIKRFTQEISISDSISNWIHDIDPNAENQLYELYKIFDLHEVPHTPRVLKSISQVGACCIVTPYYGEDLTQKLGKLSIEEIQKIAFQLLETLLALKKMKLIHNDLKPQNICFDGENATLIDFGLSLYEDKATSQAPLTTYRYCAPEHIIKKSFSASIDIWSLGCTLYELYADSPLFEGDNLKSIMSSIIAKIGSAPSRFFENSEWQKYPKLLQELEKIKQTSKLKDDFNANKTPTIKSDELFDLISKMLKFENRISIIDALNHPFFKE